MKYTKGKWTPRNRCNLTDARTCVYPIIKSGSAYPIYRNAIANTSRDQIDGILIANAYGSTKAIAEANAKLISKAPEMYLALKDLIERYPNSEWITLRLSEIIKEIES